MMNHKILFAAIASSILFGCGNPGTPTDQTDQNDQSAQAATLVQPYNNDKIKSVSPIHGAVNVAANTTIVLQFKEAVKAVFEPDDDNPSVVGLQKTFMLYPGAFVRPTSTTQKLTLTAMCAKRWRIRNPNDGMLIYNYEGDGKNSGLIPGKTDVYFESAKGSKTVKVFVNEVLQDSKAAISTTCTTPLPVLPNIVPGKITFNATRTEMTFTPTQALVSNQTYTISAGLAKPQATIFTVIKTIDPPVLTNASPASIINDVDNQITITGTGFNTNTAFFIQSTKLDVVSVGSTKAVVRVPSGFVPSTYGIMAANTDGTRGALYPAFDVLAGKPVAAIDPQDNPLSFVRGYVIDHNTKLGITGVKVSMPGMETETFNGLFFLRGVPVGRHILKIEKQGYETIYRIAEVTGTQQTVNIKLASMEPMSTQVTYIGPEGGTHYASDQGANGPFIKIPAGALDKTTPIQFTHLRDANTLPDLPNGDYLAFAHLGPTGLVFKKPATLFLPLQTQNFYKVGQRINISYFDTRAGNWVDDITSGIISLVNGKQYLEYEINHFTFIGGRPPYPSIATNVKMSYDDGSPVEGAPTSCGATSDQTGFVACTVPGPDPADQFYQDKSKESVEKIHVHTPWVGNYKNVVCTAPCVNNGSANATLTLPKPTNDLFSVPLEFVQDCGCGGGSGGGLPTSTGITPSAGNYNSGSCAIHPYANTKLGAQATGNRVVLANDVLKFHVSVPWYKMFAFRIHELRMLINDKDITYQTNITSGKDGFGSPDGNYDISFSPKEPLKATGTTKVEFRVTSYSMGTSSELIHSEVIYLDVVAKMGAPVVLFNIVDDNELTESTPTVDDVSGTALFVSFKKSDIGRQVTLNVPVFAYDEKGNKLSLNSEQAFKIDGTAWPLGYSSGSAKFVNGVASIPVTLIVPQSFGDLPVTKFVPATSTSGQGFSTQGCDISSGNPGVKVQFDNWVCPPITIKNANQAKFGYRDVWAYLFDMQYKCGNGKPLNINPTDTPRLSRLWGQYMESDYRMGKAFTGLPQVQCQLLALTRQATYPASGSCQVQLNVEPEKNAPGKIRSANLKFCDAMDCEVRTPFEPFIGDWGSDFLTGKGWINGLNPTPKKVGEPQRNSNWAMDYNVTTRVEGSHSFYRIEIPQSTIALRDVSDFNCTATRDGLGDCAMQAAENFSCGVACTPQGYLLEVKWALKPTFIEVRDDGHVTTAVGFPLDALLLDGRNLTCP